MASPGGAGPWFAALLLNVSESSKKKQTHIIAHTYPHLMVDCLNKHTLDTQLESFWVCMLKIGPFEEWNACIGFVRLWTQQTRGPGKRMEWGMHLFAEFREQYALSMWIQSLSKEEMAERMKQEAERCFFKYSVRKHYKEVESDQEEANFDERATVRQIKRLCLESKAAREKKEAPVVGVGVQAF